MITTWHPTVNRTDYETRRYDDISRLEGVRSDPYLDTKGIPTVGIGFNLRTLAVRDAVFSAMKIDVTQIPSANVAARAAEQGYIDQLGSAVQRSYSSTSALQTALNSIMVARAADPLLSSQSYITGRTTFTMQPGEIQTAFGRVIPDFETTLNNWLPGIPNSHERLALVSLAYNGLIGFKADGSFKSPALRQAILNDQRAEAWYEIRYQSNADRQHTGRRVDESNLFGLYDRPELGVQEAEAKNVLRMYTVHRDQIRAYEAQHLQDFPVGGTMSIDFQLIGARTPLIQTYAQGQTINGDVLVGQDNPNGSDGLIGTANNDLILGEQGNDVLEGNAGNDVLHGGAGRDTLLGGVGGQDWLEGSEMLRGRVEETNLLIYTD